jgi:hypothetical protein
VTTTQLKQQPCAIVERRASVFPLGVRIACVLQFIERLKFKLTGRILRNIRAECRAMQQQHL